MNGKMVLIWGKIERFEKAVRAHTCVGHLSSEDDRKDIEKEFEKSKYDLSNYMLELLNSKPKSPELNVYKKKKKSENASA